MKRSLIKVAAVAVILAFGGVGLAHDALARGLFDRGHFGHGKRPTRLQVLQVTCLELSVHRAKLLRWRLMPDLSARCAKCGGQLHLIKPWRLEDVLAKPLFSPAGRFRAAS